MTLALYPVYVPHMAQPHIYMAILPPSIPKLQALSRKQTRLETVFSGPTIAHLSYKTSTHLFSMQSAARPRGLLRLSAR